VRARSEISVRAFCCATSSSFLGSAEVQHCYPCPIGECCEVYLFTVSRIELNVAQDSAEVVQGKGRVSTNSDREPDSLGFIASALKIVDAWYKRRKAA